MNRLTQLRQLRQKINIRQRLPIWGLRAVLGLVLCTCSELVIWQNPPSRSPLEWPVLIVLYTCLAAFLLDNVVRFQVRNAPLLVIVCGLYGLVASGVINHSAYVYVEPTLERQFIVLLQRGMGLQTGAGMYGLLLFISVMRGKTPVPLQVFAAMAVGALWGIWVHWFPIQQTVEWGLVTIESATLYMLVPLVLIGVIFAFAVPRFQVVREAQVELLWWEAIVAGVPLFITLLVGMIQDIIPFFPLLLLIAIGTFIGWLLFQQTEGTEPSLFAHMTFAAPNMITYVVLVVAFLVAGIAAYSVVDGRDSVVGIAVYWIGFLFGAIGLPAALLIIFWSRYQPSIPGMRRK